MYVAAFSLSSRYYGNTHVATLMDMTAYHFVAIVHGLEQRERDDWKIADGLIISLAVAAFLVALVINLNVYGS